ncbi:Protein mono-ADP-ribosyltransferase PARP4 [Psilocybe cubensis]|uniref:Protein mono-ADP-ribosyltransferase PARP4 n=1 Tax=Psilocybe cubensis TaxID=181762 RepID=A0ACB8H138_PSICU|nr:Protein mono-ADP-ribosyltransferase PARP4 [Psilocybe cubensis]KAH9481196.1 Protein mono-ADP-ribosyltransferase PARP4 [Psilocybe cubensis]
MASHIPLALSLLGTLASHYPLGSITQKAAPPPPPSVAPTNATPSASALPSAPPATTTASNPVGNTNGTTAPAAVGSNGNTPPAINPVALFATSDQNTSMVRERIHTVASPVQAKKPAMVTLILLDLSRGPEIMETATFATIDPSTQMEQRCMITAVKLAPGVQMVRIRNLQAEAEVTRRLRLAKLQDAKILLIQEDTITAHLRIKRENLCLMCLQAPKMANSHFCSQPCIDDAESKGPMILEVPAGHVTFKSVADQFKASWRHVGTVCPPVRRVYKILAPPASLAAYNTYRSAVEARGQFVGSGRSEGNENRRWHGTRRVCNLGDKGHTQFCAASNCSLCCIIRTSYDISLWGKKTGWGRFGKGIYTSSTSSKSNDYSHNDCKSSLKAILLNKVVVGKGCKLLQDNTSLTAPPVGYDSVLAEKGGSLNYDELVVYTNDAIRPSFLVMYDEP